MTSLVKYFSSYFSPHRGSVQLKLDVKDNNRTKTLVFSESIPSVEISDLGHFAIAFFYTAAVIAFASLVIFQFANRPETSSRRIVPAAIGVANSGDGSSNTNRPAAAALLLLPPLYLDIQISCSNPPNCGPISLSVNYSGTTVASWCDASPMKIFNNGNDSVVTAVNVPLCYFGEKVFTTYTKGDLDVAGVVVDFFLINPGYNKSTGADVWQKDLRAQGIVKVFRGGTLVSPFFERGSNSAVNSLSNQEQQQQQPIRVVNIDSWQVKSLVLSQILNKAEGTAIPNSAIDDIPQPCDVAVQYEGRRPSWRANLVIFHAAYGTILTRSRSPDYRFIDVTMEIVGFTFLFTMGLQYLFRPWKWMFPGPGVPKKATDGVEGAAQEITDGSNDNINAKKYKNKSGRSSSMITDAEVQDVPIGSTSEHVNKNSNNDDHMNEQSGEEDTHPALSTRHHNKGSSFPVDL